MGKKEMKSQVKSLVNTHVHSHVSGNVPLWLLNNSVLSCPSLIPHPYPYPYPYPYPLSLSLISSLIPNPESLCSCRLQAIRQRTETVPRIGAASSQQSIPSKLFFFFWVLSHAYYQRSAASAAKIVASCVCIRSRRRGKRRRRRSSGRSCNRGCIHFRFSFINFSYFFFFFPSGRVLGLSPIFSCYYCLSSHFRQDLAEKSRSPTTTIIIVIIIIITLIYQLGPAKPSLSSQIIPLINKSQCPSLMC